MYKVNLNWRWADFEDKTIDASEWCLFQFGEKYDPITKKWRWMVRDVWDWEYHTYKTMFYFQTEEAASWFILRWGHEKV
jgi:hypothetical protein